jgi:hypothetical protein
MACAFSGSVKYSENVVPMSAARGRPVSVSIAALTSLIRPSDPIVTSASRLASSRLRV